MASRTEARQAGQTCPGSWPARSACAAMQHASCLPHLCLPESSRAWHRPGESDRPALTPPNTHTPQDQSPSAGLSHWFCPYGDAGFSEPSHRTSAGEVTWLLTLGLLWSRAVICTGPGLSPRGGTDKGVCSHRDKQTTHTAISRGHRVLGPCLQFNSERVREGSEATLQIHSDGRREPLPLGSPQPHRKDKVVTAPAHTASTEMVTAPHSPHSPWDQMGVTLIRALLSWS